MIEWHVSTSDFGAAMKATEIRVQHVSFETEDFAYRTPIKFGGFTLDRVRLLNTRIEVESGQGKRAIGRGSMP